MFHGRKKHLNQEVREKEDLIRIESEKATDASQSIGYIERTVREMDRRNDW